MNIFSRLRKAVSGIDNPLARVILFGLGKSAVWTPADYASLSKAGYENCMTVYACVNYIARAAAGIDWTATVNEVDSPKHPILALLNRPNEDEGRRAFIGKCFSHFLISGNRYVLAGRIGTQPPKALWSMRPDLVKIIPGGPKGNIVFGYQYGPEGELPVIERTLVMHSKLFHPTDDFYGLSPLSVASHAVDISNMAGEWNMRLLQNDMRPPGALSTDGKLDDNQYARLKARMKNEWQGFENAGEPILLEGGLKWVNFMLSAKEMDWLNTTKTTKRDICTVFNIDPSLVGDSEYATLSNKVEARKGVYEDVIIPFMDELADDFNAWLCPMFGTGVALSVNKDKIPALQESREKQYTYLQGTWWLRINELRKMTGQDAIPGADGETILVPMGKVPLETAAAPPAPVPDALAPFAGVNNPPAEDPNADPNAEDPNTEDPNAPAADPMAGKSVIRLTKGFWQAPERKRALWDNFVARVETKEKGLVGMSTLFLKQQAATVKARAIQMGSIQDMRSSSLIDFQTEEARYKKIMRPWYADSFIRAVTSGQQASKGDIPAIETKTDWANLTPQQLKDLDEMILESGTSISKTTMRLVESILKGAEFENMTVNEIAQALSDKLDDFSRYRCRTIARTEAAKVENWGQVEGYKTTDLVTMKGWGCSFVPDSREGHKDADGQEVEVDGTFTISSKDGNKQMAYPGDPAGGAENDVNCLCFTYPIVN